MSWSFRLFEHAGVFSLSTTLRLRISSEYVIKAGSGMAPQEYAKSGECAVWESLGVDASSEVDWRMNAEGVGASAFGASLTVNTMMLKIGQLHLQGGQTSAAAILFPKLGSRNPTRTRPR